MTNISRKPVGNIAKEDGISQRIKDIKKDTAHVSVKALGRSISTRQENQQGNVAGVKKSNVAEKKRIFEPETERHSNVAEKKRIFEPKTEKHRRSKDNVNVSRTRAMFENIAKNSKARR